MEKHYLAGPFFNAEQQGIMQRIEEEYVDAGIAFFSPRICDENSPGKKIDDAAASRIFERNEEQLMVGSAWRCTHMLAVIDYVLPNGTELRLMSGKTPLGHPITIPDTGTVFEMGMAYSLNIDIYSFTVHPPEKMNVMLSKCTCGILHGFDKLRCFLREKDRGRRLAFLEKFGGKHI